MSVFYLIGFIQSLFFSALIATKKRLKLNDLVLLFYIILLGGNLLFIYSMSTGFYGKYPQIIVFDFFYWVLLGPLLYLYIDLTTSSRKQLQLKDLLHLIPTVLVFIGVLEFYLQSEVKDFFMYRSNSLLLKFSMFVWMYNSPVYYILAIIKLRKYRNQVPNYFSNTKDVDLKWLYYLANGFAFFLIFLVGSGLVRSIFKVQIPLNSFSYTWMVLVVYIFGIGFYGYKQKGIFNDIDVDALNISNEPNSNQNRSIAQTVNIDKAVYVRSSLSKNESSEIYNKLIKAMKEEKPYLDSELNLPKLAKIINTTPHKLSYVINENFKNNFFDFINTYRIDEVKQYLLDPKFDSLKIISVAFDCGFNSKSSFYNIFKKATSLTPLQYKQQFHKQEVA